MKILNYNFSLKNLWGKLINFFKILVIVWLIIRSIGWILDKEAERAVNQEYAKNSNGIIKIANTKSYLNNHKKALVLLHGHMETPHTYYEIFDKAKKEDLYDIHLPITPFHASNLETAKNLDNQVVLDYFEKYLNNLAGNYETITVVGFSYTGLILANLLKHNKIPKNVEVILYAPSIYIKANSNINYYATSWLPLLFRNYYNYDLPPILPTAYPVYESGDETARYKLENEIGFRYRVFKAIHEMFVLDRNSREIIKDISQPFKLLIAKDDNRVPYTKLKKECNSNNNCEFISFPSGKHVIHYGKLKNNFFETISKLTMQDKKSV